MMIESLDLSLNADDNGNGSNGMTRTLMMKMIMITDDNCDMKREWQC